MNPSRQARILEKMKSLSPIHLELKDDSQKHAHHAGAGNAIETHFNLLVVSEKFTGLSRIDRQRLINELLSEEFKNGLHALQMKLYSPSEYSRS